MPGYYDAGLATPHKVSNRDRAKEEATSSLSGTPHNSALVELYGNRGVLVSVGDRSTTNLRFAQVVARVGSRPDYAAVFDKNGPMWPGPEQEFSNVVGVGGPAEDVRAKAAGVASRTKPSTVAVSKDGAIAVEHEDRKEANLAFGALADEAKNWIYGALFDPTPHANSAWPGPDEEFGDAVLTIPVTAKPPIRRGSGWGWVAAGAAALTGLMVATRKKSRS